MPDDSLDMGSQFELDINNAVDSAFAAEATTSPAPVETAEVVAETPTPDATTPPTVPETPEVTPQSALTDDTPVDVVLDGVPTTVTFGEFKRGVMRQATFTQKTQALATQRQELERQLAEATQWKAMGQAAQQKEQQFRNDVLAMLRDPDRLAALYLNAKGQPVQAGDPSATQVIPAPAQQAAQPAISPEQMFNEIAPQLESRILNHIAQQQDLNAKASEVTTFTDALIGENPVLAVFGPDLANVIYEKVAAQDPKGVAQTKEFIRLHVEDYKARVKAITGETAKAAVIAKAQAASGIQRGGSPVLPEKKDYSSFNDMQSDMEAFLA